MLGSLCVFFNARKRIRRFRLMNQHNQIFPANAFPAESVRIGKYSYGNIKVLNFGKDRVVEIGSFCSVASGVVFIPAADHYLDHVSTFPFKAKCLGKAPTEAASKGNIRVSDDVWIGQNAIILSGVHIGQGAVIAAGAVVSSDVPPYAIVGGVSAKVIKYRFTQPVIDYLLTLDYEKLDEKMVMTHIDDLYRTIDEMSLDEIKVLYRWFPKKGEESG